MAGEPATESVTNILPFHSFCPFHFIIIVVYETITCRSFHLFGNVGEESEEFEECVSCVRTNYCAKRSPTWAWAAPANAFRQLWHRSYGGINRQWENPNDIRRVLSTPFWCFVCVCLRSHAPTSIFSQRVIEENRTMPLRCVTALSVIWCTKKIKMCDIHMDLLC